MSYHSTQNNFDLSTYLQELEAEYSQTCSSATESLEHAKLKNTPETSSCNASEMESCQSSQSGMTSAHWTVAPGEAVLMSFLEDFPVRTSPVQEKEPALTESDQVCGNTWQESSVKYDPDTSSWKTRRSCSAMAATITPESAQNTKRFPNLETVVGQRTWPTPSANEDAAGTPDGKMQWMLTHAAKSGCSTRTKYQKQKWSTPQSRDWKGPSGRSMRGEENDLPNQVKQSAATGQLNPDWTEWLMGWPIGWTSLEPITELDWRDWSIDPADEGELPRVETGIQNRIGRLKAIGNGQVPQAAAMAWQILTNAQGHRPDDDKT